jgi:hypothetical protein
MGITHVSLFLFFVYFFLSPTSLGGVFFFYLAWPKYWGVVYICQLYHDILTLCCQHAFGQKNMFFHCSKQSETLKNYCLFRLGRMCTRILSNRPACYPFITYFFLIVMFFLVYLYFPFVTFYSFSRDLEGEGRALVLDPFPFSLCQ